MPEGDLKQLIARIAAIEGVLKQPKPAKAATVAGGAIGTAAIWGWNSWRELAEVPTFVIEGEVLVGAWVTIIAGLAGPAYRKLQGWLS